jgi:hypothetical protein
LAAGGYSRSTTGSTAGGHKPGFRAAKIRDGLEHMQCAAETALPAPDFTPLNPGYNKAEE